MVDRPRLLQRLCASRRNSARARAVAELAKRGAQAIGVDPDQWMIAAARERWPGAEFHLAGAEALPFDDASVRGVRADKVFHELTEPEPALHEARRVLVPGGRIVLVGQDWDTYVIDSDAPEVTRRYRTMLLDTGFQDVTVEVHTGLFTGDLMLPVLAGLADGACAAGAVTRQESDGWITEQRARAARDRLFVALPMFLAAGTSPA